VHKDSANLFYEHVHPDDQDSYHNESLEKDLLPISFQLECRLLTPDNDEIHIRAVITPVQEFSTTTDGSEQPLDGLKGEQIPLGARLINNSAASDRVLRAEF